MGLQRATIESLRFEALRFGYSEERPILSDVDFEFPMDRIVRVSGDGKSTLLRILCGLLEPDAGEYRINGQASSGMTFEDFVPLRLAMGYGFDFGGLISNKTLEENVLLPLDYHGICSREEARDRVDHWFERFDLQAVREERPASVSASQRKAAVLIRAFIHRPQVLLLDEPAVGLPRSSVAALKAAIQEARAQGALDHAFIVTSDDRLAGDRFLEAEIAIREGKLEAVSEAGAGAA